MGEQIANKGDLIGQCRRGDKGVKSDCEVSKGARQPSNGDELSLLELLLRKWGSAAKCTKSRSQSQNQSRDDYVGH